MIFATLPIDRVEATLLARPLRRGGVDFEKGRVLSAQDIGLMRVVGVEEVAVAMLAPGDIHEDLAARRIGASLAGAGLRAAPRRGGRCDLAATGAGLVDIRAEQIHALNRIDEAITVATLSPLTRVENGQIVATIKVNPFAVPSGLVEAFERTARPIALRFFAPRRAGLIQTQTPDLKPSLLDKTARNSAKRLAALGCAWLGDRRVAHRQDAVAQAIGEWRRAGADLILICGAHSTADRQDVVPAAIVVAGGAVACFGMPVDPGHLLVTGAIGPVDVVGLPGCARALQANGFDIVLERLVAGFKLTRDDIAAMGVGGLLRPAARPEPEREIRPRRKKIAAVVLAAGRSSRMGANKLTLELEGQPLIRHVAAAIADSRIAQTVVVLGHDADRVRTALAGVAGCFVVNAHHDEGLASSIKTGLVALPDDVDGAMIFLGDMPDIGAPTIDRLIDAFDPAAMKSIVAPTRDGRQGNPVLWGRAWFPLLRQELQGDVGGKHLVARYSDWLELVEADHPGVLLDIDTPEVLQRRRRAEPGRSDGSDR